MKWPFAFPSPCAAGSKAASFPAAATLLVAAAACLRAQPLVHPGGLHKLSDLERMKYQVAARVDPWHASFVQLQKHSGASHAYAVRGDSSWTAVNRDPCNRCGEFQSDATAAYLNALMWAITGDARHADKAVQIFNAWKNLREFTGSGTEALNAGLFAWKMVEAAEIIQSTYTGWSAQDRQRFKDMLVHPGYSNTGVPAEVAQDNGTFYWRIYNGDPGRHGNQDLIAWRALITMGVFLDNRVMFERALRYFKGQPHRADDIPYVPGPGVSGSQIDDNPYFTAYNASRQNTVPDYGYNGVLQHYIWENGQNQESSRDQQHAFFGLGICQGIAEVAWNQGDTVWNAHDHRLRAGFEFMGRYNTSFIQSYPDQAAPWEPADVLQRTDRTGRWRTKAINPYFDNDFTRLSRGDFPSKRPVYEQAAAHFTVRMGFTAEALWTVRSRDAAIALSGYETNGFDLDHPGWGALTFRRPARAAGDPIGGFAGGMPVFKLPAVPATLEAENFDHFPADGEGRTYHDLTPGNAGGAYRPREAVDIEAVPGGHAVAGLQPGEWLSYTVHVPAAGSYALTLRYAAANANGRIRFAFGDEDVAGDIPLPFGAPYSTGLSDWRDCAADTVALSAGVQVMRISIAGADGAFKLDKIAVALPGTSSLPPGKTGRPHSRSGGIFTFSPQGAGPVDVGVRDAMGREFLRFRNRGGPVMVNLTGYPAGRYFVELRSGGKRAVEAVAKD